MTQDRPHESPISKQELKRQAEETIRVFHGTLVAIFAIKARHGEVSVELIAKRLGKTSAEIIRWIESPRGWDTNRVADFCLAMGTEPTFLARPISEKPPDVARAIDLLKGVLAYEQHQSAATWLIIAAVSALGGSTRG